MKMVAAAKLRRAQQHIVEARPYAAALDTVFASLASHPAVRRQPLLEEREERRVTLVAVTGDKGLCGAFNANVLRQAQLLLWSDRWPAVELIIVGRKGADFFKTRGRTPLAIYPEVMRNVAAPVAYELARSLASRFLDRQTDAVYALYNSFRSIIQQRIELERLLPLEKGPLQARGTTPIVEPSPQALIGQLLPRQVEFQFLRVLLDSQAAEHAARMTAMDAASKNAGEMIDRLTLTYNRVRQATITRELIEIVSGAEALAER
jgi:F-type H+-transporting ATPase subunit gamma